jgi:NAD(P)-dependent dehydrogenase (short-subunit alcohol dehydrogenase family)
MELGLEGKVALVTGTASQVGIGKAICLNLAKEGCDIIASDIDLEGANQTADEVKALGRKAIAVKADVADKAEVEEMVKAALKEFGRVDILVNTAGIAFEGGVPYLEQKKESWQIDIDVNLYGTMNCSQAVLPGMLDRKYGKIINFASIAAKSGLLGSYAAAKAGVSAVTRGLATQYGPEGINANAIAPGMVRTRFFDPMGDAVEQMYKGMAEHVPTRRIQTVEDIANTVAFLVSDISRNITGQTIQVDSGMVML